MRDHNGDLTEFAQIILGAVAIVAVVVPFSWLSSL
jgi:hypothetical protein